MFKKISHKVICDRIELGTYLIGGALAAKKLNLTNIESNLVKKEISILKKMGVQMKIRKKILKSSNQKKLEKLILKQNLILDSLQTFKLKS